MSMSIKCSLLRAGNPVLFKPLEWQMCLKKIWWEITSPDAGDISYSISSSQLIICVAYCPSAVSPTES